MRQTKRLILVATLIVALLAVGIVGTSCSSSGGETEEPTDTPQEANPPGNMPPSSGFLSDEFLAKVTEILGIDQEQVADAFEQAQSEMMDGMPRDRQPPEGMSPEDMPPEDELPEDMPSEDMLPEGMPSGFGLPDELLARAAEILGIDQQALADAVEQAQDEMASETAPPSSNQ